MMEVLKYVPAKKSRELPPVEGCFLLLLLDVFLGRVEGGAEIRLRKKSRESPLSKGAFCKVSCYQRWKVFQPLLRPICL